ncbi:MAG: glycosyltransferase family 4 protein [Thalassotalea sp.]
MSKIAFVVASPETVSSFLLGYLHALAQTHDVHVVCSLDGLAQVRGLAEHITVHDIKIHRDPKIWQDLKSLLALYRFFKKQNFDLVHSYTPKAGLLTQISARFANVNKRFHTFTGQVWATKTGFARQFLKLLDKITASMATFCLADSPSQQAFLINEGLLTPANSDVLLAGSVSGVDLNRFCFSAEKRKTLRAEHGFNDNDFLFMFVGRLKKEKGLPELITAFNQLSQTLAVNSSNGSSKNAKLVIIGSDEENLSSLLAGNNNIHYLGFKTNVNEYYSFADMLMLPSHREGFGNVIIEAAACHLPSIASNIYGLSDAVHDGVSGYLHPVKNVQIIEKIMTQVLSSPEVVLKMRQDASTRVAETFDEALLIQAFIDFYQKHGVA